MKSRVPSLALLLAFAFSGVVSAVDETKPYGRVCLSLSDAKTKAEASLADTAKPGAGERLLAHVDANTACEVLLAAFAKAGGLANGWRPALVAMGEWDEQVLLKTGEGWNWEQAGEPFEVFVVFLPKGLAGTEKVRDLVAKLREPKLDPALAKLQARQLREELSKWAADPQAAAAVPETAPVKIGGTMRAGAEFPWREHARKLNFSETKPAVTVFRHAGS